MARRFRVLALVAFALPVLDNVHGAGIDSIHASHDTPAVSSCANRLSTFWWHDAAE